MQTMKAMKAAKTMKRAKTVKGLRPLKQKGKGKGSAVGFMSNDFETPRNDRALAPFGIARAQQKVVQVIPYRLALKKASPLALRCARALKTFSVDFVLDVLSLMALFNYISRHVGPNL